MLYFRTVSVVVIKPDIFEVFVFLFCSNEHEPSHVHAVQDDDRSENELIKGDGKMKSLVRRKAKGFISLSSAEAKVADG